MGNLENGQVPPVPQARYVSSVVHDVQANTCGRLLSDQTLPEFINPGLNDVFQSNKKIWAMAGFSFTLFIQNAVELGQNWSMFDNCDYNVTGRTVPNKLHSSICKWYLSSLVLLGLSMLLQCTHAILCFCNTNPQLEPDNAKMQDSERTMKLKRYSRILQIEHTNGIHFTKLCCVSLRFYGRKVKPSPGSPSS